MEDEYESAFIIRTEREAERERAMTFCAEVLHHSLGSKTKETTAEEELIIFIINRLLTDNEGWKFERKTTVLPDGTEDVTYFTAKDKKFVQIFVDISKLIFTPNPRDKAGVREWKALIEKYRKKYAEPGMCSVRLDIENKRLIVLDFARMVKEYYYSHSN